MSAQALSPNDLLLFMIGRPGAGKSTFARYLTRAFASTRVLYLNDYDLLLARAKKLSPSKIKWEPNGQFEILDRSLFDRLFEELIKAVNSNRGRRPIIVEFSRPTYLEAFAAVPALGDGPYTIVYLDVPLQTCIQRNSARAPDYPISTIPEAVIRKYYSTDPDLPALQSAYPGRVRIVQNVGISLHSLEREAHLLLEDILGTENVSSLRPLTSRLQEELTVAGLLIVYMLAFLSGCAITWRAGPASFLATLLPDPSQLPFAKTVLYVCTAGGLGSTTYCIRALYHYYISGVFDFDRFKWWYFFRPPTGSVLAISAFALVHGGVVALGGGKSSSGPSTENMTWFGIAFLAGFGTEQVIEWLRRASKTMFGESRVQPEEGGDK